MSLNEDLWTCPKCGYQFINANTYHSCGNFNLEDHFVGKDEQVREIFDALVELVEGIGPVKVYAQKTRIVFQVRTRFASHRHQKILGDITNLAEAESRTSLTTADRDVHLSGLRADLALEEG